MQTYDNYLTKILHSEPYVRVLIGGIDVTSRLVRDEGIETDTLLDTPELGVYTSSAVEVFLTNHDNYFSAKQNPNFFTENSTEDNPLPSDGWRVPVVIQGGFHHKDLEPRVFFYGEIEEIFQIPGVRQVRVLVLDLSTRLRRALVDNVGETVSRNLFGGIDSPNYTEVNPVYQLGNGDLPVSRESFSARIKDEELRVHPALPTGGALGDYHDVSVNLSTGVLTFGAEPPDKDDTTIFATFKTAYRYRTAEFLIHALAEAQGVYRGMSLEESVFARMLLKSPTLRHPQLKVTSRGRPRHGVSRPLVRGIASDLDGVYLCGDRALLKYERRTETEFDNYSLMGQCPDNATLLEIVQHGDDFLLLSSASFSGHLQSKIWRFRGNAWSELAGPGSGDPTSAYPYSYDTSLDAVSDNRKSFVVNGDYLYYVFGSNSGTARNGVRRVNLITGNIGTVFSQGSNADYGIDFVIDGLSLFVFVCQRGAEDNNYFRIFRMGLDGSGAVDIYSEQFDRRDGFYPATASDIVVLDGHFYFVYTEHRTELISGRSELSRLPVTGGTREVLKRYDNALYAARSLSVYKNKVYWVEGQWISAFGGKQYPTFSDAGHLQSCDTDGTVTDHGGAWRSYVDGEGGTGFGVHTAFASNLWHDNLTDSLFFIAGYGIATDVIARDNILTDDTPVAQDLTNWVWLQWGQNLATRVSVLHTNGRSTWELMSEIARTVDYEIGFTEAHAELETFYATYPAIDRFAPRQYLFFRPKAARESELILDGSVNVEIGNALDTTLIFNHILVPYGDGVWPEPDPELIAEHGSRPFPVRTSLLQGHDQAWAEILGKLYLERQRVPRHKVSILLKYAPHLETGQYVEISSEWNSFKRVPFQLTQVEHFSEVWQTRIEAREITVASSPLRFDEPVFDAEYILGSTISVDLPVASGGLSPITYTLENLPDGVTFVDDPPSYSGTATKIGTSILTYQASDASDPKLTATARFRLSVRDRISESVGIGVPGLRVYLLDNLSDTARVFSSTTDDLPREIANDRQLPAGDYFDATATSTHLIVLDKSGTGDRVRFFSLQTGAEDGTPINLDSDRQTGEPRGDWRAIAYHPTNNLLYVMNLYGVLRTYKSDRTQDTSKSVDLDLCADWQAMAFRVESHGVVTLLTLIGNLPVVLAWDITQPESGPARFPAKDVFLHEKLLDWTGIGVVQSSQKLYACRRNSPSIFEYDLLTE